MNTQIEIDLGLARVSDDALAILEGASGVASLPPILFSMLLDALAEEHLRRRECHNSSGSIVLVGILNTR